MEDCREDCTEESPYTECFRISFLGDQGVLENISTAWLGMQGQGRWEKLKKCEQEKRKRVVLKRSHELCEGLWTSTGQQG